MKHYRNEVEEKQTEAPAGRSECGQQHEDADWDRTKHPQKARELVSFVNMSQAGNDTKDNCHGVARFAFCRFCRPMLRLTTVGGRGIFRSQSTEVWVWIVYYSGRFML